MVDFIVKDSGKRVNYKSGMRRDTTEGKPMYNLIDKTFLYRLAVHLAKGAEKYGKDNWKLASSQEELERFEESALRHMMQWLNGDTDEDHMSAIAFNIASAEYVKEKLQKNKGSNKLDVEKVIRGIANSETPSLPLITVTANPITSRTGD